MDTIILRPAFLAIYIIANLMKLATIFLVSEHINDFQKICIVFSNFFHSRRQFAFGL